MARPKKQPTERRSACVQARVTLAERRYVQSQAAAAGLSEADYVRQRALDFVVRARASAPRFDSALVSEINRLGNQLSSLGNLANQIALYCHTDRRLPDDWRVLPHEIKQLLRLVEVTLEKVLHDGPQNP